jgi:hypothetical protein
MVSHRFRTLRAAAPRFSEGYVQTHRNHEPVRELHADFAAAASSLHPLRAETARGPPTRRLAYPPRSALVKVVTNPGWSQRFVRAILGADKASLRA